MANYWECLGWIVRNPVTMANSNKTKLRFVDFYATTITGPKGVRQASRYLSLHSLRPPSSAHYSNLHMQQGYLDPFSVFFSAQVSWLPSLLSACARECASECYTSVLPMYSLLCSNITKLIFRGTVKLLMGSHRFDTHVSQYLHIFFAQAL